MKIELLFAVCFFFEKNKSEFAIIIRFVAILLKATGYHRRILAKCAEFPEKLAWLVWAPASVQCEHRQAHTDPKHVTTTPGPSRP